MPEERLAAAEAGCVGYRLQDGATSFGSPCCVRSCSGTHPLITHTQTESTVPLPTASSFSMQWQPGDFLIADNLALGHEADPDTQLPRSEVGWTPWEGAAVIPAAACMLCMLRLHAVHAEMEG